MSKDGAIVVAVGLLALLFASRARAAAPLDLNPQIDVSYPDADPWAGAWEWGGIGFDWNEGASPLPAPAPAPVLPGALPDPSDPFSFWDWSEPMNDPAENLRAFLYALRVAETSEAAAQNGDAYFTMYGGSLFRNLSDHPIITGEKQAIRLPDSFCAPAGLRPPCYSTAAGAYQIIRPTWDRVRRAGAWGEYLPDFSKRSQDEAARRLLLECGALTYIEAGDVAQAIARAAPVWASLPGSTAQQGGKSLSQMLALYDDGKWWG